MVTKLLLLCLGLVVPAMAANLPFIIGGTEVTSATKWPWQCSLQLNGRHYCGASIISSTWLVTAAHCVQGSLNSYTVRCGSVRNADGMMQTIKKIINHEDYGSGLGAHPNDIAVVELSSALPLTDTIKPIPMISTDPAGNSDCYITGWGQTTGTGSGSPVLMEALINVYTMSACKNSWGSYINDGHICIGNSVKGRGACFGDSGGPVVCRVSGQYELVGAASWVYWGCETSYPSVYSRIPYFRQWIKDNSGV